MRRSMTFSARARRSRLRAIVALGLVVALTFAKLVLPGTAQPAAAAGATPVITGVSQIIAQNSSTIGETSGPGVVITGSGFGATPPAVTQSPTIGGAAVGSSALGVEANTSNLQVEDTTGLFTGSFMSLFPNDQNLGDCFVTIGAWSDTRIIVLLDDTGLVSCSNIKPGDGFNVTVSAPTAEPNRTSSPRRRPKLRARLP